MKNLLLILALFVGNSFAEDKNKNDATQSIYLGQLKGEMNFNCVVKDQIILTIQDGISESWNFYIDQLKIGDKHVLTLRWFDLENVNPYDLFLGEPKPELAIQMKGDLPTSFISFYNAVDEGTFNINVRGQMEKAELSIWNTHQKNIIPGKVNFRSESHFFVSNSLLTDSNTFSLKRYYKNDWDYVFNRDGQILVSNCMNAEADVSKFIRDVKLLFK